MKKNLILLILLGFVAFGRAEAQSVIFLHHSTGGAVYSGGNVAGIISDYNNSHGTDYKITERAFPGSPYPWSNYPFDYWHLWVDGNCNSEKPGIECLETLTEKYDVIIWKHCYPGSDIASDAGEPDISSSKKTLGNYKLQYLALRTEMAKYPDTKFLVWTLAPRHRLATNSANAARAGEFVRWVKNEWAAENPENIYIFDFFGLTAELSEEPENGETNCLKYEYEKSHTSGDSHPNALANQTVGPLFAAKIIEVIEDGQTDIEAPSENPADIYPNPADNLLHINMPAKSTYRIIDITGKVLFSGSSSPADISELPSGVYLLIISKDGIDDSRVFIKE